MKNLAVVLSGCGVMDGSEINEAVLTLLAIDKQGAKYQCFAPNRDQYHVVNHLTGEETSEKRNILVESARIARGEVKDLQQADLASFDGLIFPGGFGAAKNLCDFAISGVQCTILPEVAAAVEAMKLANKPVGFICIAPAMIPKLYPKGVKLTIGTDEVTATKINNMGGEHVSCPVTKTVVDAKNKVVSTPAYMLAKSLSEAAVGIEDCVKQVLAMA